MAVLLRDIIANGLCVVNVKRSESESESKSESKIVQPLVPDEDTPLYIIDINDPWQQKDELILGDSISTTYIYTVPLKPGETTVPLCNGITMAPIPLPSYASIDDINITINMYAEEAE